MNGTQSVPNLIQGVSQQATQQRRDAQCEEQFDCFNTVADGAGARPHTELVKLWPGRTLSGAFFTEVIRKEENYLLGVYNEEPLGINLSDGADCDFGAWSNADGYLSVSSGLPKEQFRAQVSEDTVFLLNRGVVPVMDPSITSPVTYPEALIFVRSGDYSSTYTVGITGKNGNTHNASTRSITPDAGAGASRQPYAKTTYIADALANGRAVPPPDDVAALNGQNGYTALVVGSVIRISRADQGDFDIETNDGNGDAFMYAFKDFISSYSKLPAKGFPGFTTGVRGDDRSKADDFYVRFTGPPSTGSWEEVVKPGIHTTLQKSTMPHLFQLTGLNTFTYGDTAWSTRIAGDETSSPDPGFVGKRLRDVAYHQNRLLLLYDGGASWSKDKYPFTFFADTAQAVLATAPIDIKLRPNKSSQGSDELDFAVQVDETLSLWSPRTQFRISWGQTGGFKQETIENSPSTAYEYARGCDPLAVGQFLYFPTTVGPWSTVRSIQSNNGKAIGDINITAHIPKYIAKDVRWLTASDTLGCIFAVAEGADDGIYCYNFLFQEQDYAQSAWNKWRLPGGPILWASIRNNALRLLQQRPEGVALLKVNLTPKAVDDVAGAGYLTRLDMRVTETQVTGLAYNSGTNTTTFTLPYIPTGPDMRVIVAEDRVGGYKRAREFDIVSVVGALVTVKGDLTGYKFYAGQRISASRKESRFYVRRPEGVLPTDRLTVDDFAVEFADTGYTRIEVASANKSTFSYEWESRTAGLPDSLSGTPTLRTDSLKAPVRELAENAEITLINDSFLPSYWQSASYTYTAVLRGPQK